MSDRNIGQLVVNYGMRIFINISDNPLDPTVEPVWAEFGSGINNLTENLNENVIDAYYLINHGWGNTEVTAMHPSFELTGVRYAGDPAQDWIFGRKWKMLDSRKTQMKVQCFNPDNPDVMYDTYMADITISNLQEYSGATETGSDISMTLSFNGSPTMMVITPIVVVEGNNTASVTITATTATENAIIYYQVDEGAETVYTAPIVDTTTGSKVYKFVAKKEDLVNSEFVSKTIVVTA